MLKKQQTKRKLTADRFFHVGAVTGSHGLKGALTIYSHTRPAIGIAGYSFWWIGDSPEKATCYKVERCWQHKKALLAELEGICDRDASDALKGLSVFIDGDEVEASEDEYLWEDLVGCRVVTDEGRALGEVAALQEYGAQDILTVVAGPDSDEPGEWMLPFTEEVVLDVDLDAGKIEVHLPEGMDACFTPRS